MNVKVINNEGVAQMIYSGKKWYILEVIQNIYI
jgi:hypothetical protein